MNTLRSLLGVLALTLLAILPEGVTAQPRQGPPDGREHLEQRVRDRFDSLIRNELAIDESTAVRLRETMESFIPERRALGMRNGELRRRLRELDAVLPPVEAKEILDDLIEVQEAEVSLFAREQARILEFLSPGQLLRFYALRDQFEERVRRLRDQSGGSGEVPSGPRRGGGGGHP
ncbi:hypothetical protein [Gaopeijia maritima]|uniref:Periplasmic heavy metal sensor n=1 Tax=Gaopeijia maritima TaxID=3119007 RepID=A0ABU9EAD8_9BACT